jgi:hypothetical protein
MENHMTSIHLEIMWFSYDRIAALVRRIILFIGEIELRRLDADFTYWLKISIRNSEEMI